MTLVLLMSLFQPIPDDELVHPAPTHVAAIIETLPREPELYAAIVDEAFVQFLVADEDDLSFQRFVDILRLLLYHDGRSELGLLRVAQLAHEQPRFAAEGVNALAALANHYRSGGASNVPSGDVLRRCEAYMQDEALFHNARECRNAVKSRVDASGRTEDGSPHP